MHSFWKLESSFLIQGFGSLFIVSHLDKVSATTRSPFDSVSIMASDNEANQVDPLGLANGDQDENGSDSESGADNLSPDVVQRIKSVLDKPHDGSKILLDWNAFDPGAAIRENDVKNVWERLLGTGKDGKGKDDEDRPPVPYNRHVANILRQRLFDLKKDMLAYAKNKAYNCMIQACVRRELATEMGSPVNSISSLRKVCTTTTTTCAFYVTNTLLLVLQRSAHPQPHDNCSRGHSSVLQGQLQLEGGHRREDHESLWSGL